MDCQLPDIDGLEASRRIRVAESRAGQARTPIIAMTASEALSGSIPAWTAFWPNPRPWVNYAAALTQHGVPVHSQRRASGAVTISMVHKSSV